MIIDQQQTIKTPPSTSQDPFTVGPSDKMLSTKRMEYISTFPTSEIIYNSKQEIWSLESG